MVPFTEVSPLPLVLSPSLPLPGLNSPHCMAPNKSLPWPVLAAVTPHGAVCSEHQLTQNSRHCLWFDSMAPSPSQSSASAQKAQSGNLFSPPLFPLPADLSLSNLDILHAYLTKRSEFTFQIRMGLFTL